MGYPFSSITDAFAIGIHQPLTNSGAHMEKAIDPFRNDGLR
jgi:hypothetical protein